MSSKDKQLTESLVRTRKVIANKFRKLNRNRVLQERDLEIKYAPLTKSIDRLIDTKDQVHTKKNDLNVKSDPVKKEVGNNAMEIDNDEDLMQFDDEKNNVKKEKNQPTTLDQKYLNLNSKKNKQQEKLETERKEFADKRKNQRTDQYDMIRFFTPSNIGTKRVQTEIISPEDYDSDWNYVGQATKRSKVERPVKSRYKRKTNSISKPMPDQKSNENESSRRKGAKRANTENISAEDYDSDWNYIGQATKKSKVERPVKSQCKRKTNSFPKSQPEQQSVENKLSRSNGVKRMQNEIISPEDYDSDWNYVGLATKRRKVERPVKSRKIRKSNVYSKSKQQSNESDALGNNVLVENKSIHRPKVRVSLEDYNDKGELFGVAKKRRRIEISKEKFDEIKANRKRQWRLNKKNIKYDGKGLEKSFIPYSENIVYEYYDDPNELVDRLMLLVSSKSAGNSNHDQEINSIIEELRERDIID